MKELLILVIGVFLISGVFSLTQTQNVTVTVLSETLNLMIYSPLQDKIYNNGLVPINLSINDLVNITYSVNEKRFATLCRNCSEYGYSRIRKKLFDDGKKELIIKILFENGSVIEKYVNFTVDSKELRILKTLPIKGKVTNGSNLYIKYSEENLRGISINWNPTLILTNCNESGKNKECYIDINLTNYDGKYINYWFNITDYFRSVNSKITRVFVDTTSPILIVNSPIIKPYGKKVPFNITISEKALLEYYDNMELNPRWKILCTNCEEYGNIRKKIKYFKKGNHDLLIRAVDRAGNSASIPISFNVNY